MQRKNVAFAVVFIFIGVMFLLGALRVFSLDWTNTWPFVLIILSVVFHAMAIASREPGTLVPGGILLVVGIAFLLTDTFGVDNMGSAWPLYVFAPALGLFELYLFGTRERSLLIPVFVLSCVSGAFVFADTQNIVLEIVISVMIILFGLGALFAPPKESNKEDTKEN